MSPTQATYHQILMLRAGGATLNVLAFAALLAGCHAFLPFSKSDAAKHDTASRTDGSTDRLDIRLSERPLDLVRHDSSALDQLGAIDRRVAEHPQDRPAREGLIAPDLKSVDAVKNDQPAGQKIIITEMMINPNGSDPPGEWFELYNAGSAAVDLSGWQLKDNFGTGLIQTSLTISAGQYLVLRAKQADVTGYVYSGGLACSTEICFNNDGDWLKVYDSKGVFVDGVTYDTSWPYRSGQSMSLRALSLNRALPGSWCTETQPYSKINAGTPGAAAGCK